MANIRSILTFGLADLLAEIRTDTRATHTRLQKIEDDIVALRSLMRMRDDRSQTKLKAAMASLANLISILPELGIKGTLPHFPHQGFEITGEEAAFLFHLVRRHRPRLILELGSGSSTVLFAAAVRANGSGRVISAEHDAEHARHTRELLEQAGLSDHVELIVAPLVEQTIRGRSFQWYDLAPLLRILSEKVDLLFVDGPPGKVQSLSRYPALPVLMPHLAPRAQVFVDDGARDDETAMVAMWRDIDAFDFESEALDFLPHAPRLLTMAGEARVAGLRRVREERSEAEDDLELLRQSRKSVS